MFSSTLEIMCSDKIDNKCNSPVSIVDKFLNFKTGRYNSVIVNSEDDLCHDEQTFSCKLVNSLQKWNSDGVKIIWFHVPLKHSKCIPVLIENNFIYHRVSDLGKTVVLYRWLPNEKPCSVPPYAHTMVGVGGIVINNKNEILVVLQRYGSREILKLPGGYLEPNEEIDTAAVREVEEETGIKTKFQSCILFRHMHHANFGCSDLYFIVQLKPLTDAVHENCDEVIETKWMPIDEFINHPKVHDLNRLFIKTYQQYEQCNINMIKQDGLHPVTKSPYSIYLVTNDELIQ